MKVTDTYLAEITDFGTDGKGVAKIDGTPVFVPYAAKGDLCKIKITEVKKSFAEARIVKIIRPSGIRSSAPCYKYGECGGCVLQHVSFAAENQLKREVLINTLRKAGVECSVGDTVSGNEYGYRNKLQMPFTEYGGKIRTGFFRRGTHDAVPLDRCILHGEWAAELIKTVELWANDNAIRDKLSVYDEKSGKGLLRHLVARYEDGFLFVTVVINGKALPNARNLYELISEKFECALYLNENTCNTNVIMGNRIKLLYGKERELGIRGIKTRLSPLSFLQVNDEIRDKLYEDALKKTSAAETIIDVYSGIGIFTAMLAKEHKNSTVYGVEIVKEAVFDADRLMLKNGLSDRVKNYCGDAAKILPELVNGILNNNNVNVKPEICITLDPPRKGCDKSVLDAVMRAEPDRAIYVSCNPATLARDLKILSEKFRIVGVTPYNMFPRTAELETLCELEFVK